MLSTRLKDLERADIVVRDGEGYRLTEAGTAPAPVLVELAGWTARWDRRGLRSEHLDPDALVWDIRRRVVADRLPTEPTLVGLRFPGHARRPYYLLARRPDSIAIAVFRSRMRTDSGRPSCRSGYRCRHHRRTT